MSRKELTGVEGVDYVVCAICGRRFINLPIHLSRAHNISKEEYLKRYPGSLLMCDIGIRVQKGGLDKGKKTNLERYGVENVFQSEVIKDKIKKDTINKYGVEYNVQRSEIIIKISTSLMGHEVSEERREKQRRSMKGKLVGDKNSSKRPEVAAKIRDSLMGHKVTNTTRQKIRENMPDGSMENNGNWQGGLSFEKYPKEFFNQRNYIREKYNNGVATSVHHIDYNKQNSNEDNLIPLSKDNHGLTNGKRHFWYKLIKYSQNYDKYYYKENKRFNIFSGVLNG